jgi:N-formylmaleamate deformylase
MNSWTQGFLESKVGSSTARLKYFRSGGALPPLVLVHGFTDSALYFTRLAEALSKEWDVVAYDARGHGESSRLAECDGQFDDDARVQDLVCTVETLKLDRPVLIGHSMGGATIALTLSRHPGLSRGAVLEDPAWWELDDDQLVTRRTMRAQQVVAWAEWVSAIQAMTFEDAVTLRSAEEPAWNLVDIETSLYARRCFDLDLFGPFLPERSPWRDSVKSFEQPVMLTLGSRADRGAIITADLAEEARGLNPLLMSHLVEGAGHHLRYDQFDDFLSAVQDFVAAL